MRTVDNFKMTEKMTVEEFNKLSKKKPKYNNQKVWYDNHFYDSKKEAGYAMLLDSLKKAKKASDRVTYYERQIPFEMVINKIKVCTYIADFKVFYADGRVEVVDVKGMKTQIYKLKKKLLKAVKNIDIIEI